MGNSKTGAGPVDFEGDRVKVELESRGQPDVRIDAISAIAFPSDSADAKFFSIVNPDSPWKELYEEYNDLPDVKRAGDSVGLIMGSDIATVPNTLQSWCCSGVLLSPDIMLTNWHCGGSQLLGMQDGDYWRASVRQNTLIDLGWAKGAVRRQYSPVDCARERSRSRFCFDSDRSGRRTGRNGGCSHSSTTVQEDTLCGGTAVHDPPR